MARTGTIALLAAALVGGGCANTGADRVTVIVGATLVTGSAEVPDSVVVIDGKRIRAVGPRPMTPIPQDSERIDGSGRIVKADGHSDASEWRIVTGAAAGDRAVQVASAHHATASG